MNSSNIMVADVSFIPMNSPDYKSDVNKAINIIRSYKLEYEIGIISTTVRGDKDLIFKMIQRLYNEMGETCSFFLDIRLSNLCGCDLQNGH